MGERLSVVESLTRDGVTPITPEQGIAILRRLVSDPDATVGRLETSAAGADGSRLHIIKEQPMKGVSGTEMAGSVLGSLQQAMEQRPGLVFG